LAPRGSPAREHQRERGAALVEFAIVLPLALGLILGTFTGGTAYFRKISIVDAVREGSRYASSLRMGSGVGAATAWESSVKNRVVEASGGELTAAEVCVKLVYPSGGTDCGVPDPPGASAETTVHVVKLSATKPARIEFLFLTLNLTVTSKLAARYERDTG
jgi:hypothetical protein